MNNWVDGVRKASDFDTARVCDAYKVNIALLEAIKASSTKKYHVLMHGLFKKATYVLLYLHEPHLLISVCISVVKSMPSRRANLPRSRELYRL